MKRLLALAVVAAALGWIRTIGARGTTDLSGILLALGFTLVMAMPLIVWSWRAIGAVIRLPRYGPTSRPNSR